MNLKSYLPKIETAHLLLVNPKNIDTVDEQTKTHPRNTKDFSLTKARETFSFEKALDMESCSSNLEDW